MDAYRCASPSIDRHVFHKKYYFIIVPLLIAMTFFGMILLIYLPQTTLNYGIGLSFCVVVYFLLVNKTNTFYFKELIVAMVYSVGIFIGPLSTMTHGMIYLDYILVIQLFLHALINLTLFSLIEYDLDRIDGHHSIVQKYGLKKTKKAIKTLFIILLILQIYALLPVLADFDRLIFQCIFILMTTLLYMVFYFQDALHKHSYYRVIGDGIFFMPALYLFI